MRRLAALFIFATTFSAMDQALALPYRSYEFQDQTLDQRADLAPIVTYREADISASVPLVKLTVRDVDWSVRPELADFLQRSRGSQDNLALPAELVPLATGDVKLDAQTLDSPRGQIRVMLQPLLNAGVPSQLLPLFADPDFIKAAQTIAALDDVKNTGLTLAQKRKFAMLQGALMWRIRGGGLYIKTSGSTTWRQLFTVRPMAALAGLGGASFTSLIGQEFWLGLLQSWGRYFDIGRFPNQEDRYHDLAMMVKIGARLVEPSVTDLGARGYETSALEVAGRQFGACYDFAHEYLTTVQWGDRKLAPYVEIAAEPTQWAELCAGASFGLSLMETLTSSFTPAN